MKNKSLIKILVAIFLAITVGSFVGPHKTLFGIKYLNIFSFFGELFLNALMLIVIPLISSSIIFGISKLRKKESFENLGIKTFLTFILLNFISILVGFILVNIFKDHFINLQKVISVNKEFTLEIEHHHMKDLLLNIIPKNIFLAFTKANMLGIIFFCILFGFAITKIEKKQANFLNDLFKSIFHVMIEITHFIMKFLPFGVFFLVAKEFSKNGLSSITSLSMFSFVVLIGFSTLFFIIIPLFLIIFAKKNPITHFKDMLSAIITGFSTSSSAATLPITMSCLEDNAKIDEKIVSIVAPLGTSLNLSASAMYVFIASSFIAILHNVDLTIATQISIFAITFLLTLGSASIPSGALIAIIIILKTLDIPPSSIGIIIIVERFLDMFRTPVNIFAISTSTQIISKKITS
jgi:proton glutamate symport protein